MATVRQRLIERVVIRLRAQEADRRLHPDGKPVALLHGETVNVIMPEIPGPRSNEMNDVIEAMAREQGLMDYYMALTDRQYYRMTHEIYRQVKHG